jgi:hypothetical protein
MKTHVFKPYSNALLMPVLIIAIASLFFISCRKTTSDPIVIPVWEDNSADSAKLSIKVMTPQGMVLVGQYVNLALSTDSLAKKILVRSTPSNTSGSAVFNKLYPRKFYYNCIALNNGITYFGSGSANMLPSSTKDTTLIVYGTK